jgi:hypothetical protein
MSPGGPSPDANRPRESDPPVGPDPGGDAEAITAWTSRPEEEAVAMRLCDLGTSIVAPGPEAVIFASGPG